MKNKIYTKCKIKNRDHKYSDILLEFNRIFEYLLPICKHCNKPLIDRGK